MADLRGGAGPSTSNGNGNGAITATSRPPRVPLGQTTGSPSGVRGPRAIMQERAAREARQREERERLEREHALEEARRLEEAERKEEERQRAAAAAAGAGETPIDETAAPRRQAASSRVPQPTLPQTSQQRPSRTAQAGPSAASQPGPSGAPATGEQTIGTTRIKNTFPHAFERWETLSAHWEGLTSFWIRRLEQNAAEFSDDPISQQLSRQVTDLSSAGANLFHAVVELQRLRASSERKFQRWFLETRSEIEHLQEAQALLETQLESERRSREDLIRQAVERAEGTSKVQKQLSEMRRELTISKEEARRAWEELGRREQEERDRTNSLQMGHPTIVGGVQVVPMTHGGVSRRETQRDPRSYAGEDSYDTAQTPDARPEYTQAPAVQPVATSAGEAYSQPSRPVQHQGSYGSEGTFSEGEYTIDAQGNFVRDSRGDKIPFQAPRSDGSSDVGAEEYETPATQPGPTYSAATTAQQPQYSSAPDYSGAGYSAPGWETMPRHHHPTRLSDVIEEDDERSRTSASQSQAGRG